MITLFNNITLTPEVAPFKADRFVLVGSSVVNTYQTLLVDPEYNRFDDELSLGAYAGSYHTASELLNSIASLAGTDQLEVIASADTFWPIYVAALKASLPRLDVNSLHVLLTCAWFQITYVEPSHRRGLIINPNAQASAAEWIDKPTLAETQQLFNSAASIPGLTIDPTTLPWEFQVATMYAYPNDPSIAPIKQSAGDLTRGMIYELCVRDRVTCMLKNLPDMEKITGIPYDVDQDFNAYVSQFPILNEIFTLALREDFRDATTVSDADLNKYLKDFAATHLPKHYDMVNSFISTIANKTYNTWYDMYVDCQSSGSPLLFEPSVRFNYNGYVNPNIFNYLTTIKGNSAAMAKFAIK